MQRFIKGSVLVMFFMASTFTASFAQIHWTKDVNNPVMSGGASGTWNRHLFWPDVLYNADSTRYEMWFSAAAGPANQFRPMSIGFATSPDGINWTMHPDPVLEPDAGTWDESSVEIAMVIRENGQYKMWYSGWSPSNEVGKIGYATSSDGINWTKDTLNNPVMVPSSAAWQAGGFFRCHVLPDQGGYKMWYDGFTADWRYSNIGYATSSDGITWTPDTLNNPVLTTGSAGSWDDGNLELPHILFINNVYHIWYTGTRPSESLPWQTGWATSDDGIHWYKYNNTTTTSTLYSDSDPVLKPSSGQWDGTYIQQGTVMREGDSLRMWYSGSRSPGATYLWRIGHATVPFDSLFVDVNEDYDVSHIPEEFSLLQNYPNPFNPSTTMEFSLPQSGFVTLSIYNIVGEKVATLVSETLTAGSYKYDWNGSGLASGVYYYRLEAGKFNQTKKLVLLR